MGYGRKLHLSALVLVLLFGTSVLADEANQTTMKVEDTGAKPVNAIQNSDEIDELITNNNLRAYSGSKSRWSIASTWNYNGGTIGSPLSQDRPNIADTSA